MYVCMYYFDEISHFLVINQIKITCCVYADDLYMDNNGICQKTVSDGETFINIKSGYTFIVIYFIR